MMGISINGFKQVVVPLIALRQDLQRRCQEASIDCREWNRRSPPDEARIVLITPESARNEDFIRFSGPRTIESHCDRRMPCGVERATRFPAAIARIERIEQSRGADDDVDSHIAPHEGKDFMKRMWLQPSDVETFRGSTTRKNIQYQTYQVQGRTCEDQETDLLRIIRQARASLVGSEKVVVYSGRVEDCKSLATSMECEAYFHDAKNKKKVFKRFASKDKCNIIVVISAFEIGVDVPHIRWVIHVNEPRTLFDYSQESGRARRDGMASHALIIRNRMKEGSHPPSQVDRHRQLVEEYLDARCRRVVLDEYLDGRKDRDGCEAGEETCEGCDEGAEDLGEGEVTLVEDDLEGRSCTPPRGQEPVREHATPRAERVVPVSLTSRIIARHQQEVRESQEKIRKIREALDCVRGRCAYCFISGQESGSDHYMYHCPVENCDPIRMECNRWKKRIRGQKELTTYGGCHWCFLPQAWCKR